MAKRKKQIKLSQAEQLEKDLNKWLGRKEDAIKLLIKSIDKLQELRRAEARLDKRERNKSKHDDAALELAAERAMAHEVELAVAHEVKQANKRIARTRTVSEATNIPVSELPIADVLPDDYKKLVVRVRNPRKRKAEAVV